LEEPVVLTDDSFIDLADALFAHIGEHFSIDKCRWAIAGLFSMDGKNLISREDIETIQDAWIKLTPVDERKKRLIDLGLLIVDTKTFEKAPELGTIVVDYRSTTLGKYVAGRDICAVPLFYLAMAHPVTNFQRRRGKPMGEINFCLN
jgi:hypothetical protein